MIHVKITNHELGLTLVSLAIMIYAASSLFASQCQKTNSYSRQICPPCNDSSVVWPNDNPFLQWEETRLNELWPVQGIPKQDTSGGINARQVRRYIELALLESKLETKTVCETGFFRGGSTLLWMMLFKDCIVHSFDTSFPDSAVNWFNQKYPGRLVIHTGDSKQMISTLPKNTCDWISVDGDHGKDGAYTDIKEFAKVSKPSAFLVSDDTFDCTLDANSCTECGPTCPCDGNRPFCNECSHGFRKTVDEKIIDWMGCDRYGISHDSKYPIGSCYGFFS
jgi:hypothetical protein